MKYKEERCPKCGETPHRVRKRLKKAHTKGRSGGLRVEVRHCLKCNKREYTKPVSLSQKIKGRMG